MSESTSRRPRATFADWKRLIEDGQVVELIDGEIVPQDMGRPGYGRPQLKLGELLCTRQPGGVGDIVVAEPFEIELDVGELFGHEPAR